MWQNLAKLLSFICTDKSCSVELKNPSVPGPSKNLRTGRPVIHYHSNGADNEIVLLHLFHISLTPGTTGSLIISHSLSPVYQEQIVNM